MSFRCHACGTNYDRHTPWCSTCASSGTVVLVGRRNAALVDFEAELTTARDLARAGWQHIDSAAYPSIRIGRGALVVLMGGPGDGKSSLASRLLDGLPGTVVYVSAEEPPGPSLAARLLRVAVKRADFLVVGRASVDQVVAICRESGAIGLAVDSVQVATWSPRDCRHLLAVLPRLEVVVAVAQVNKTGRIEGRNTLEHEADIVVECEELRWTLTKSRYQALGVAGASGDVLRSTPSPESIDAA
jgi:predicted ATP-dependent serine protease